MNGPKPSSETDPAPAPIGTKIGNTNEKGALPAVESAPPKKLTPEEQMALYEKALKEDDWGHQPC